MHCDMILAAAQSWLDFGLSQSVKTKEVAKHGWEIP